MSFAGNIRAADELWRAIRKNAAIKQIMAQPFFYSPRRRWTPEEIAEYVRGHNERTRQALERIEDRMEVRREWRGVKR